jgi:hypothetical protein
MPFRIQEYGASYALLQLPAVRDLVTSQQWRELAAQVVSSHARMEQLRQAPFWQAMIPGLAGTLSQLQGDVQGLTAAVQQQPTAGQVENKVLPPLTVASGRGTVQWHATTCASTRNRTMRPAGQHGMWHGHVSRCHVFWHCALVPI